MESVRSTGVCSGSSSFSAKAVGQPSGASKPPTMGWPAIHFQREQANSRPLRNDCISAAFTPILADLPLFSGCSDCIVSGSAGPPGHRGRIMFVRLLTHAEGGCPLGCCVDVFPPDKTRQCLFQAGLPLDCSRFRPRVVQAEEGFGEGRPRGSLRETQGHKGHVAHILLRGASPFLGWCLASNPWHRRLKGETSFSMAKGVCVLNLVARAIISAECFSARHIFLYPIQKPESTGIPLKYEEVQSGGFRLKERYLSIGPSFSVLCC